MTGSNEGKVCTQCQQFKTWAEFSTHPGHRDGYQSQCKNCRKLAARKRWADGDEQRRLANRAGDEATRELVRRFPEEYAALLDKYRDALGLLPSRRRSPIYGSGPDSDSAPSPNP